MGKTPQKFGISAMQTIDPPIDITNEQQYQLYEQCGMFNPKTGQYVEFSRESFDIEELTGIQERRFFSEHTRYSAIVKATAERLLAAEHLTTEDCADIIVTGTHQGLEEITNEAKDALNMKRGTSLNFACSGFAAAIAEGMQRNADITSDKHVLIITAEFFGDMINLLDRNPVVFGDGVYGFLLTRDARRQMLKVLDVDAKSFDVSKELIGTNIQNALGPAKSQCEKQCITMNGRQVFVMATKKMVDEAEAIANRNNMSMCEAEFLPHGANERMKQPMAENLNKIGLYKGERPWTENDILMDIAHTGNTGASSVPAYIHNHPEKFTEPGTRYIASVIGAGPELNPKQMTAGQVLLEKEE